MFKKIFLILVLGLIGYSFTEPLYTPTALPVDRDHYDFPEVIAHKGLVSDDFPGNSLSALRQCLATQVDGIEVDVRLSKDGILFLYHGDKLEDYTDQQGIPEDYDWAFLAQVSYKGTQDKLISLDEFFNLVGTQKIFFIDLKSNAKVDTGLAHAIVDSIKKHHLQDTVFVESFNPITLGIIRLYARDIMLMYDFTDNTQKIGEESQEQFDRIPGLLTRHWMQKQIRRIIRPDVLGPRFNFDSGALTGFVKAGYPVVCWAVDDPAVAVQLLDGGVKGVQSNVPLAIERMLSHRNKKIIDAGGSSALVRQVVRVKSVDDIQAAVKTAKESNLSLSIGGRRHSMGGQSLSDQSIFLNMLTFNEVKYNPSTKTVTAQAGATWKKVQEVLVTEGRSVKVMQSDNIFTVGGSISVNVHGWQVGAPPIGSTIVSMTVMTVDGAIQKISPTMNPELFKAVIGGYGMFAIILDVELETVPNSEVQFHADFTDIDHFNAVFSKKVGGNPNIELAYARLSVDSSNLLDDVGVFWFETKGELSDKRTISPERLIAFKRMIFRLSEYSDVGKKLRWLAEKYYAELMSSDHKRFSRTDAMNTDIHVLWSLYGDSKDILHEYFVPKHQFASFLRKLKEQVTHHHINLLNVTIRDVKKDDISLLPYAKEDVFGLVCLFSQGNSPADEAQMQIFTQAVIDDVLAVGGTFYLPYRLHYTGPQLLAAYPEIKSWVNLKKKYDPQMILKSQFFDSMLQILG